MDLSCSFGRAMPSRMRGSNSASSLVDPTATSKVVSLMRAPLLGDFSTAASVGTLGSFHGSGIADLRATAMAQQRQIDGIVDKVANVVAAMHEDALRDVRCATGEVALRLEELRRAGPELDRRLHELREGEGGVQAWLRSELEGALAHSGMELERAQERSFAELEDLRGQLLGEVQAVRDLTAEESSTLQASLALVSARLDGVEESVQAEPRWQEALQLSAQDLREEFQRMILETTEPLTERLLLTEQRLMPACDQLLAAAPGQAHRLDKACERLGFAEADARRHEAELVRLEEEIQMLRQAEASARDAEAQAGEWQRRAEDKFGSLAAADSRLNMLEQWRKRTEERLERPASQLLQLQDRFASSEQRLEAAMQRLDGLHAAPAPDGTLPARLTELERRLDEVDKPAGSFVALASQECYQLERRIRDQLETISARTRSVEAASEATRQQLTDVRTELRVLSSQARSETRTVKANGSSDELEKALMAQWSRMQSDLHRDIEAKTSSGSQRVCEDLQRELNLRVAQMQMDAQKHADELRRDIDERHTKLSASSERLAGELRQEVEAASSGARARPRDASGDDQVVQKLSEELHDGLREVKALRAGLDGARSFADEMQRQVSELRAAQARAPDVEATAREAADSAVSSLRSNLRRDVADRLERCDAAAASCERCARAAEERLRKIANDLQAYLACDGVSDQLNSSIVEWPQAEARAGLGNAPLLVSPQAAGLGRAAGRVATPTSSLLGAGAGPLPTA